MEVFFIIWLALAVLVGVFADSHGRSGIGFFFLSILMTPVFSFIVALVVAIAWPITKVTEAKALKSGEMKKCPSCAELVKMEANICKHCSCKLETTTNSNLASIIEEAHFNDTIDIAIDKFWAFTNETFFNNRLANGQFGLPITVFLGVFIPILSLFLLSQAQTGLFPLLGLLVNIPCSIGMWRSADQFEGNRAWALLIKVFTVVFMIPMGLFLLVCIFD
ncbi:hypothetical protein [Paraglaciecola sp. MB-3u-78]|uniref:hypothetical protein n=1 Tax=Paraglaciecola sp. MB-3u-78 TaxID=2058332 RepID=UPI000C342028|nr:hypothetical protein [Paraglaciecola sp. MB-3u-78]PKG96916.1 hypothetical protein CXF95_22735 [Paraglaciecola sp. MB-3u-78]